MTETSPIGTIGAPPADWDEMSFEEQVELVPSRAGAVRRRAARRRRRGQGPAARRQELGPAAGPRPLGHPPYFQDETGDCVDADGWFDTGDVAVIHPDGTMQITDRSKDVIKSGGEWISSVELENAAVGCPGVAEAAAIGVHHPKWDERPLLLVVRKEGADVSADDDPGAPRRPCRQMVAAGRDPVRRQPAPHRDRQAAQDRACASSIATTSCRPLWTQPHPARAQTRPERRSGRRRVDQVDRLLSNYIPCLFRVLC